MRETESAGGSSPPQQVAVVREFERLSELVSRRLSAADGQSVLGALETLHRIRAQLDQWEPALIAAARSQGLTWAQIAPVLGLASRQAAERRYLRLNPHAVDTPDSTRERRVEATRDARSADRAVADWARKHAADLRQLAGQVTALDGAARSAGSPTTPRAPQPGLDRVRTALAGNDAADLVDPLTALGDPGQTELRDRRPDLADQVAALRRTTGRIRDDDLAQRTAPEEPSA